jgi:dienelactone hydrolase
MVIEYLQGTIGYFQCMMRAIVKTWIFLFLVHGVLGQAPENPTKNQISQIFPAKRLNKKYLFKFPGRYEEHFIRVRDGILLNALLFHSDQMPKGVILYLHGNTGGMEKWGKLAPYYTVLGYDFMIVDYRGYGKSEGSIKNEGQLFDDLQITYDSLKNLYPQNKIVIMGYSIGTGPAAMLASSNQPEKLILDAPYYSLLDAVKQKYPAATSQDLAFYLETYSFLPKISCRIAIFHGDSDSEFYYGGSLKLKSLFKPGDTLITLKGQDHSDFERNAVYLASLQSILP